MPVDRDAAASTSTASIGRAGVVTAPGDTGRRLAPTSAIDPHAWHSGHCPSHFATVRPHSLQRCEGRSRAAGRAMRRTLAASSDKPREAGRWRYSSVRLGWNDARGTGSAYSFTGTLSLIRPLVANEKVTSM